MVACTTPAATTRRRTIRDVGEYAPACRNAGIGRARVVVIADNRRVLADELTSIGRVDHAGVRGAQVVVVARAGTSTESGGSIALTTPGTNDRRARAVAIRIANIPGCAQVAV